jgi:hypothetical protein
MVVALVGVEVVVIGAVVEVMLWVVTGIEVVVVVVVSIDVVVICGSEVVGVSYIELVVASCGEDVPGNVVTGFSVVEGVASDVALVVGISEVDVEDIVVDSKDIVDLGVGVSKFGVVDADEVVDSSDNVEEVGASVEIKDSVDGEEDSNEIVVGASDDAVVEEDVGVVSVADDEIVVSKVGVVSVASVVEDEVVEADGEEVALVVEVVDSADCDVVVTAVVSSEDVTGMLVVVSVIAAEDASACVSSWPCIIVIMNGRTVVASAMGTVVVTGGEDELVADEVSKPGEVSSDEKSRLVEVVVMWLVEVSQLLGVVVTRSSGSVVVVAPADVVPGEVVAPSSTVVASLCTRLSAEARTPKYAS